MADPEAVCRAIEDQFDLSMPHGKPPHNLYHYTDARGFRNIIESGCLWATHSGFLNDWSEVGGGEDLVREVAEELERDATERSKGFLSVFREAYKGGWAISDLSVICVTSFCCTKDGGDVLSQWRAYGASGRGYSIGFRPDGLRLPGATATGDVACWLVECVYDPERIKSELRSLLQRLLDALRNALATTTDSHIQSRLVGDCLRLACRGVAKVILPYKNPGFREEHEWRLVVLAEPDSKDLEFRESASGLVPFVSLDQRLDDGRLGLASVTVGPTQHPEHSVKAAELFLRRHGYSPGLVTRSTVPLRGL